MLDSRHQDRASWMSFWQLAQDVQLLIEVPLHSGAVLVCLESRQHYLLHDDSSFSMTADSLVYR